MSSYKDPRRPGCVYISTAGMNFINSRCVVCSAASLWNDFSGMELL